MDNIEIDPNSGIFSNNDIGYLKVSFRFGHSNETGELEDTINIVIHNSKERTRDEYFNV